MRSEPSSFERIQVLRTAPAPAPPVERLDDTAGTDGVSAAEEKRVGGGFLRFAGVVLGMAALGVVAAMVWWSAGPQMSEGARTWLAFASPPSLFAGSRDATGELDRIARELDGLKATIGELSAAQHEMAAGIAALQAAQQQLRVDQQDLAQRAASIPAAPAGPAAFSNALAVGNAAPPAPAAAPRAVPPQRQTPPAQNARTPNPAAPPPRP